MFKRNLEPILEEALARSPVVLLNGARQVGKTTLATKLIKEKGYSYETFDDEVTYLAAKSDRQGFIANLKKPVIIDEVQRVPELFLAIKRDVDLYREPGRYLLTGSANPLLIPRLGDSLAGRMEILNLMPLSQGEIEGKQEQFIDLLFSDRPLYSPARSLTKEELYKRIVIGGYPLVLGKSEKDRESWLRSYISLILQRDVKELAQIEKLTEFPNLLGILASRVGGLLNVADIARDSKMVAPTMHRYLALLETLFMINLLPSWHSNLTLKFVKSPKLYMVDSGLMAYLLGINESRILNDGTLMGKVFENFVVGELKKQVTWNKTMVNMHHFRAATGEEVDVVLESISGDIVGIEIKNTGMAIPDDFNGLKNLAKKVKNKFVKGVVLYTGARTIPFGDNLFAVPINMLWD